MTKPDSVPPVGVFLNVVFVLVALFAPSSVSSNSVYGQQEPNLVSSGDVEVTVIHLNLDEVNPEHFAATEGYAQGYISVYDDDGDFIENAASCNLDTPCKLALPTGIYEARIVNPNSLTIYAAPFEVIANVTHQLDVQMDQGLFEIAVFDEEGGALADSTSFSHPGTYTFGASGGYLEEGWFAMYETNGDFVLDGITCNYDEGCSYPYDSGEYIASIRSVVDDQIMACTFSISDNAITPVEFYLDSGECNQTTTDVPSAPADDESDDSSSGGSNNGNSGSGSGSNNNSGSTNSGSTSGSTGQSAPSPILKSDNDATALLTHSSYIDHEQGFYHVVGEVQNQGRNTVMDVSIYGIFYEGKEVITVKRGYSIQQLLDPGEKSPFEIEIRDPSLADKITSYTLTAPSSEPASYLKQEYLGVNVTRQYYDNATGLYHVRGVVTNYADSTANFVKVSLSFYDQNNSLIYVASKYAISSLEDSIPSPFDISFAPLNATQISRVSANVESKEYSMVKAGFLQSPITLTLDSSAYRSGMSIMANGTVGNRISNDPYAVIDILWPDGILNDKELVRVSADGSYRSSIGFFSPPGFEGEMFTVRISYGQYYAEDVFVFVQ